MGVAAIGFFGAAAALILHRLPPVDASTCPQSRCGPPISSAQPTVEFVGLSPKRFKLYPVRSGHRYRKQPGSRGRSASRFLNSPAAKTVLKQRASITAFGDLQNSNSCCFNYSRIQGDPDIRPAR